MAEVPCEMPISFTVSVSAAAQGSFSNSANLRVLLKSIGYYLEGKFNSCYITLFTLRQTKNHYVHQNAAATCRKMPLKINECQGY